MKSSRYGIKYRRHNGVGNGRQNKQSVTENRRGRRSDLDRKRSISFHVLVNICTGVHSLEQLLCTALIRKLNSGLIGLLGLGFLICVSCAKVIQDPSPCVRPKHSITGTRVAAIKSPLVPSGLG